MFIHLSINLIINSSTLICLSIYLYDIYYLIYFQNYFLLVSQFTMLCSSSLKHLNRQFFSFDNHPFLHYLFILLVTVTNLTFSGNRFDSFWNIWKPEYLCSCSKQFQFSDTHLWSVYFKRLITFYLTLSRKECLILAVALPLQVRK